MMLTDYLEQAGEHALLYPGTVGPLELVLTVPEHVDKRFVAMLGHPHSLQGGTMNNKVVTTLTRLFKSLHIPSIRCNFRGVGASAGVYDAGIGESEDLITLGQSWLQSMPNTHFILAGFSFGSYVVYRAAKQLPTAILITIAPPVHHFDYHSVKPQASSWIVVQGNEDDVVPTPLVDDFVKQAEVSVHYLVFPETGHFFHGKLLELRDRLAVLVQTELVKYVSP